MLKNSILKLIDINELQHIIYRSTSLSNTIQNVGLAVIPQYLKALREIISANNLDISSFSKSRYNKHLSDKELFIEGVVRSGSTIRTRYIKVCEKYQCVECGNLGIHNNKKLVLHLDHINGKSSDNRLENLRWLCPNCHSQTDTYTGRNTNRVKKIGKCCDCGVTILAESTRCVKCSGKFQNEKVKISEEDLAKLVLEKPLSDIGKMFGVNGNAIKKRCKKLNINTPYTKGYWQKKRAGKI